MNFTNLKVIELASVLAGPSVGMFFAELGAQVIKIENKRTNGDVTRNWKLPNEQKDAVSAYFSSINWGKQHLFIDYSNDEDYNTVLQLLMDADLVICNFKQGAAAKFNLDYASIKALNPSIIYAQLNGFESTPERVAFDVVLQAECGYMYMNGQADSPPTKMPLALMDILAAHQLKEGILVALINKATTGKGAYVESSLEEAAISSLANQATNWLMNKKIPQRMGSLHPNIAPYGDVFQTKDNKELVLAIGSDAQFQKFCKLLGSEELSNKAIFLTNEARVKNRSLLKAALADLIINYNRDELIEACIKNGIPMGAVRNMQEVFETPIAQKMILEEQVGNQNTKRVKTIAFNISE
ncbi:MAG: CoA transferase [Flavobacteriales bacterium]|jgi:crotonobetainyl-CoA:carnitine CoA-transferase CaiB-like acyl-CoA transferase|nr:CoA transferase [Flavobacteriales bacterium]